MEEAGKAQARGENPTSRWCLCRNAGYLTENGKKQKIYTSKKKMADGWLVLNMINLCGLD